MSKIIYPKIINFSVLRRIVKQELAATFYYQLQESKIYPCVEIILLVLNSCYLTAINGKDKFLKTDSHVLK